MEPAGLTLLDPFVFTTVCAIGFSVYMLFFCPAWLEDLMQLTPMPSSFKLLLVIIAGAGFVVSIISEQYILPRFARFFGTSKARKAEAGGKQRKKYKGMEEQMRF